jgi:hypothetical protein
MSDDETIFLLLLLLHAVKAANLNRRHQELQR